MLNRQANQQSMLGFGIFRAKTERACIILLFLSISTKQNTTKRDYGPISLPLVPGQLSHTQPRRPSSGWAPSRSSWWNAAVTPHQPMIMKNIQTAALVMLCLKGASHSYFIEYIELKPGFYLVLAQQWTRGMSKGEEEMRQDERKPLTNEERDRQSPFF